MRIAILNTTCGYDSPGKICAALAKLLNEEGHTCRIFYGREMIRAAGGRENSPEAQGVNGPAERTPEGLQAVRFTSALEVYSHALAARFLDRQGLSSRLATKRLINALREFRPDVVHLHNLHGYYLNYPLLFEYLIREKLSVVWTLHDCWAFTGHCVFSGKADCEKWREECGKCPAIHTYPESLFFDLSRRHFDRKRTLYERLYQAGADRKKPLLTIAVPSAWMAGQVRASILKAFPVRVVRNGIDTGVFRPDLRAAEICETYRKHFGVIPEKYGGTPQKRILLGVANAWTARKGLPDLLSLAERLPEEYRVCLVGIAPDKLTPLPERVLATPRTSDQAELARLYAGAEVFVNPTYDDNYPTTNLEAAACGTRVVTYETGGSPESILDTRNIVPQGDLDALLHAVRADYESGVRVPLDARTCFLDYLKLYKEITDT